TYKMGEAACQMLIDKIKGDKKIRQIIIPTCLQVRESSIKRKD
ncbi:LacI family transcriptional regulator, partial [Pseudomonas aeruginosa]